MDQILRDEPVKILPVELGGVDAENFVKPQTRFGQIPKSKQDVNETDCGENYEPVFFS
jgi:hypothetical protein